MQKFSITNIDLYLFNLINGYAKKYKVLDFFGIFCAKYLAYMIIMFLLFYSLTVKTPGIFFLPMAAGIISLMLNESIYLFYRRKRPMEVIPKTMLIGEPFSPAFPSSHTSFFFALAFTIFLFNPLMAIVCVAASFCISFFRVFCGVHWPSDIVGGIGSAGVSFLVVCVVKIWIY